MSGVIETSMTVIDHKVVIALSSDMTTVYIDELIKLAFERIENYRLRQVVLNFKSVDMLDSFGYKQFLDITKTLGLMGIQVVWCSLSPAVITSFLDLEIPYKDNAIRVMKNMEEALGWLEAFND